MPAGGLNVVDARDVAALLPVAMARGTPGGRYLLGAVNWTFAEFFGRLERLTKIAGAQAEVLGRRSRSSRRARRRRCSKKLGRKVPVDPESVEMAQYFWYLDAGKAARELGWLPRDPADTLRDTVDYVRERLLGNGAFKKAVPSPSPPGEGRVRVPPSPVEPRIAPGQHRTRACASPTPAPRRVNVAAAFELTRTAHLKGR